MDRSLVNKQQHFSKQLASSFAFGPWQPLWAESQSILWWITQLTMICVTQFSHGQFHAEQYEGSNETFLSGVCGVFLFLRFLEDSEWLIYAPVKWLSISVNVETLTKVWSTGYLLKYTSIQVSKSNSSQKRRKTMSTCLHDYFILSINSVMINGVFFLNLSQREMLPLQVGFSKGTNPTSIVISAVLLTFPTLIASCIIDCWLI